MSNELSHDEEVAEFVSRLYSEVGMPRTENALLDYLNQRGIEYAVIDKGNQFMFEIEVQRSKVLDIVRIYQWNEEAREGSSFLRPGVKSFGVNAFIDESGTLVDLDVSVFYPPF